MESMRVLSSPSETGSVTLCMPHDVQTEALDFPSELFEKRIWYVPRNVPDSYLLEKAVEMIKNSKNPMLVAGGGVIYSEAENILTNLAESTGIPVVETFAGKGSLHYKHELNLGAIGATGTKGANEIASNSDLVIGVGTRYSDFITASKSAWQNPNVSFININVAEVDVYKNSGIPLQGDARDTLKILLEKLKDFKTEKKYTDKIINYNKEWDSIVEIAYEPINKKKPLQSEYVGALNKFIDDKDVLVCASGSLPGDLHKLWRTKNSKGFHLEYGYSCMGYEIPGGLGAKMADPKREVYVMCGDATYLMLPSDLITTIQEGYKIIMILINNNGYASIGSLSESVGGEGFGTHFKFRNQKNDKIEGDRLPVDLAANAESLGAKVYRPKGIDEFNDALVKAKKNDQTSVIYVETVRDRKLDGYSYSWWEVPVPEISISEDVKKARKKYELDKKMQKQYLKSNRL